MKRVLLSDASRDRGRIRRSSSIAGVEFGAGAATSGSSSPTVNAPWALEEDQDEFDSPDCGSRPLPFNAVQHERCVPTLWGANVDAIVGDPVNNTGFSNFGCTIGRRTRRPSPSIRPIRRNLIAGANDYRVCCDFTRV